MTDADQRGISRKAGLYFWEVLNREGVNHVRMAVLILFPTWKATSSHYGPHSDLEKEAKMIGACATDTVERPTSPKCYLQTCDIRGKQSSIFRSHFSHAAGPHPSRCTWETVEGTTLKY